MQMAFMLSTGQQCGLAECDAEMVRHYSEITLAVGGTIDSESDPPWVLFNPPSVPASTSVQ
jgi:hypothetical protein